VFETVLIANRGEIAVRIIRACRELGIKSVAVYSKGDRDCLHVRLADDAICIGNSPSAESYLHIPAIITAAEIANVEAIHPGYGFLAEDSHFAEICESCHIRFIGPSSESITKMGNKSEARQLAKKAGIPIVPGSEGVVEDKNEALKVVQGIGYPVIVKAAAGGGGRGMRIAHNDLAMVSAFMTARAEAEAAFGSPDVYIEKYMEHPRHVEVQILADNKGSVIHLGERDCTLQRRHQKLIEESPSPAILSDVRKKVCRMAVKLAQETGYVNAGTVEFLVDGEGNYYFIEMNTRVQVEHTVTEMVTGVDIIKEQLRIAFGEPLSVDQKTVRRKGAAIECRINAEDPDRGFVPQSGRVSLYVPPGGPNVRVDSHLYAGYTIPSFYDSLLAKVIAHGKDRMEAIHTMRRALDEIIIEGVPTTIPFHRRIIEDSRFVRGDYRMNLVEELLE
jgi:acetyl-CoA carboxylase biotin carboxylase subunit